MIKDDLVKKAVHALEKHGGDFAIDLAAMLMGLLAERNQAYRNGQRTMIDKIAMAAKVPIRMKILDHWSEDMSPSDAFDMGAISAAAAIHKKLSELASAKI